MAVTLRYTNLIPKFLDLWAVAHQLPDGEERWQLWKERYDFAAVPPTEYGYSVARRLVTEAWSRYPAVIDELPAAVARLQERAPQIAEQVGALFALDRSVEIKLLTFVGGFEANAFASGNAVCMPVEVEMPPLVLAHELIHQVHHALAGSVSAWQRPIGMMLMEEGLATRGSRALFPEFSAAEHLSHWDLGWVSACEERHAAILSGVLPYLSRSDDEAVVRFSMQEGPAGLIREGYWAGWHAVGQLQAEGWSLARLARLTETEVVPVIEGALRRALAR